ncbi:MAG: hypothetical protein JWR07_3420 [Nevskia sp.]|nr:hypothetical protein [Nevskia sp.]
MNPATTLSLPGRMPPQVRTGRPRQAAPVGWLRRLQQTYGRAALLDLHR